MANKLEITSVASITGAYAFCHFVVDFACIATTLGAIAPLFASQGGSENLLIILAYDAFAFFLQLPFGMLMDSAHKPNNWVLASFTFVALGVVLARSSFAVLSLLALICLVLGNAIFHAAGAVLIIDASDANFASTGVFLSTGGLGVFLASRSEIYGAGALLWILLLLIACSSVLCLAVGRVRIERLEAWFVPKASALPVALIALTVALRSYVGLCLAFPWKLELIHAVAVALAIFAGKFVGGFLADKLDAPRAAFVSFAGAALFFPFSWSSAFAGLMAAFLFNITMALTLVSLARLMPAERGLAFGIRSAALAAGALPALLGYRAASPVVPCILSVLALVLFESAFMLDAHTR